MIVDEKKIKNNGLKGLSVSKAGVKVPNRGAWRIMKPIIDYKRCIRCHTCWLVCPDSAMKILKSGFTKADDRTCKGCGACVAECPVKCIKSVRDKHRR